MTGREKEILQVVQRGAARGVHPTTMGREMGISADYAEQLCRDMVWLGHFVKAGLRYKVAPPGHLKKV